MIIFLYYSTNCLFNLAILVLFYMSDGPDIVTITSIFAAGTAFGGIIYFYYRLLFSTVTVVVNVLCGKVQGTFKY